MTRDPHPARHVASQWLVVDLEWLAGLALQIPELPGALCVDPDRRSLFDSAGTQDKALAWLRKWRQKQAQSSPGQRSRSKRSSPV